MTELLKKRGNTKAKKVTFDNNELAKSLYGERNSNLHLIEKRLNIICNIRGNDIILQGDFPELETAENLLTQLYGLLKEGYPVYERDVEYSLRILNGNHKAELKPIFLDRIYIPSKKKTITPKSLN
ncbi:MAG: phosphate starvation-inducible protein PhoH, partial [Deltaproteobacteria bacterium]|nr:phosphate starvation-inducible protein PhoH [Deltaproteobacteria bacterium]